MITLATVLTPVVPGREDELATALAALPGRSHQLADTHAVHFARWVIIGSVHGRFPRLSARRRQLRMKYLLMTAAVDGPFETFVESLRTTAGPLADEAWSHCVGYPTRADRSAFHAYFAHNRLDVPHSYVAYQNTVPDVHQAVELRARHLQLAQGLQGTDDDRLDAFVKAFP